MPERVPVGVYDLELPPDVQKICLGSKHIGFAWQVWTVPALLAPSFRSSKLVKRHKRWAVCMLDGTIVTTNSRTLDEARATLVSAINRVVHRGRAYARYRRHAVVVAKPCN